MLNNYQKSRIKSFFVPFFDLYKSNIMNLKLIISLFSFLGILVSFQLYSQNEVYAASKSEKSILVSNQTMPKKTLLFFMDPNGRPCQIQYNILVETKSKIEKYVKLGVVQTTNASHRNAFYRFGVRALPTIIVLDDNEKVVHRFTPGIRTQQELLNVITKLN